MDIDAWNRLAKKTRRVSFFFIGAPVVRASPKGGEIVESRSRFVNIIFGTFVFAAFLLFAIFVVDGRDFTAVFFRYTFGALGFLGLLFLIFAPFVIRCISLDPLHDLIRIQMRDFITIHTYEFDVKDISVELIGAEDERLTRKVHTGRTLLVLSTHQMPQAIIKLAISEGKSDVEAAYQQLSDWLGGSATDKTLECVRLEDGSEIRFARTSIGGGGANFQDRRIGRKTSDVIVTKNTITTRFFFPLFMGGGILCLSILPSIPREIGHWGVSLGGTFLCAGMGILFLYFGLAGALGVLHTGFSADRRNGVIRIQNRDWKFRKTYRLIPFNDVLGIQILNDDDNEDPYMNYELDLVLKKDNGERIMLIKHGKERAVNSAALELSEFLGCRFFDHRTKR